MKRKSVCMLTAFMLVLLCACSPAAEPSRDGVTRTVKVVELHESSALVVDWAEVEYSLDLCSAGMSNADILDENGKSITVADLRPGMILEVTWGGLVAESWPCQIRVDQVRVVEQGDDLVGLYRAVLSDLWENDSGLNHDAELLGFDFSTLINLTDEEMTALEYLASCDLGLGLSYVVGTWEELCDQGYIDRENLHWENGVFLSLTLEEEPGEKSFAFTAEKWRSGLGAIFFTDCTAKRGADGQWSYEPGGFAIS